MERPIDSHQWASKIEARHLLSGKPESVMMNDAHAANDESALRVISLPPKISSIIRWFAR
ncbi:MAG TPA: hypothetical protein ENI81_08855 [Phycisphaerales bacterium]|nr:hypothetical protein [Phycisphaerales bacterium]